MSRSPLIPNCVFYSKALPLCSALFCALPSHPISSHPFVLLVERLWMLPALAGVSHPAALQAPLPISGSLAPHHIPLLPPRIHRRAWKVRQVVPSFLSRKLGFKNNLSKFSFHVGYTSIRRTGQSTLCIFINEWKCHSYLAVLGQWLHVPLMQMTDWIYPMEFPGLWNAELGYFRVWNWSTTHGFHLRKSSHFWFTVCSTVTAVLSHTPTVSTHCLIWGWEENAVISSFPTRQFMVNHLCLVNSFSGQQNQLLSYFQAHVSKGYWSSG